MLKKVEDFDIFLRRHPLLKDLSFERRVGIYRIAQAELYRLTKQVRVLNDGATVVGGALYPDWNPQAHVLLAYTRRPLSGIDIEHLDNYMVEHPFVQDLPAAARKYLYDFAAVKLSVLSGGYMLDMMKPDSHQVGVTATGRIKMTPTTKLVDLTPIFTYGQFSSQARVTIKDLLTYTSRGKINVGVEFPVPSPIVSKGKLDGNFSLTVYGVAYHYVLRQRGTMDMGFALGAYETDPLAPAQPQDLRYAVYADTPLGYPVYLNWDAVTNVKQYFVYKKVGAGAYAFLTAVTNVSYTDYVASGTYYYKVTASNAYGESGDSAEVTVTI